MSFLTLNGWTIPTRIGGNYSIVEIGKRDHAYDGTPHRSLRAKKREWKFKTIPEEEKTAQALIGCIRGEGHVWAFNGDTYSNRGIGEVGSGIFTYHAANADDGDPVVDANGISVVKFGTHSIAIEDATTNLLAADQRDAEGVAAGSYTAVNGATLAMNVAHYWQGAQSLKCSTDFVGGDQEGFFTDSLDPGAGSATRTYTGSVYLKGDAGGEILTIFLKDETNGVEGTKVDITLTDNETWYRVSSNITIGGVDCRALRLYILEKTADSDYDWYSDGFQIEEMSFMTSWVDGSRGNPGSGGTDIIYYQNLDEYIGKSGYTWSFWTKGTKNPGAGRHNPFYWSLASGGRFECRLNDGTDGYYIQFYSVDAGIADDMLTYDSSDPFSDGDWHMITLVSRKNPESGENAKEIFLDGSLVAYNSGYSGIPIPAAEGTFYIGTFGSVYELNGQLDDFIFLPYAATADQIAAWYAMGEAISDLPYLLASGDFVPESQIEVEGEVTNVEYEPHSDDVTWRDNACGVEFVLRER